MQGLENKDPHTIGRASHRAPKSPGTQGVPSSPGTQGMQVEWVFLEFINVSVFVGCSLYAGPCIRPRGCKEE